MNKTAMRLARWIGGAVLTAVLAACGGGGGGGDASPLPAPVADARNGAYAMLAADAREYTLTLDFDAMTYVIVGTGVSQTGSFAASGDGFVFLPGNGIGTTGFNTTRFSLVDNGVVGEFALPSGALPFIAARSFQKSISGAVGTYNFLGRTVDTAGGVPNTTIQQGEITAGGTLRTCDDATIFEISACPAGSVTTGTLTVSGEVFTSTTPGGAFPFRIANIGGSKVFLRGSASSNTTRRFIVGMAATTSFGPASFVGGTSEPAWGTVTVGTNNFSSTGTSPSGVTTTMSGTVMPMGSGNSLGSLLLLGTTASGSFFATRSAEIGVVIAARGNAVAPGFIAIGKRQ